MEAYFTVKSISNTDVTFHTLRTRLVAAVNARLQNGEFTERGLAKILGVSQPHIHNVLKGARTLQWDLADRFISDLGIRILDLWNEDELATHERFRVLPPQPRSEAYDDRTGWVAQLLPKKEPGHEWKNLRTEQSSRAMEI